MKFLLPLLLTSILPAGDLYSDKVRPLLASRCLACHGQMQAGGLRLDSREKVTLVMNRHRHLDIQTISHRLHGITQAEVTPPFQDFVVWLRTEGPEQKAVREAIVSGFWSVFRIRVRSGFSCPPNVRAQPRRGAPSAAAPCWAAKSISRRSLGSENSVDRSHRFSSSTDIVAIFALMSSRMARRD